MKNFEITAKENGKKYWISRSVAVCAIVIVYDEDDNFYLLINKRGQGTPDYQGCWNIPCGYLDWDETTSQACSREVLEECKLYINDTNWQQFEDIEDSVDANRQNVTVRKIAIISYNEYRAGKNIAKNMDEADEGELNEVDAIELMQLSKRNIDKHSWAFNHKDLAAKIMNSIDNLLNNY